VVEKRGRHRKAGGEGKNGANSFRDLEVYHEIFKDLLGVRQTRSTRQ